MALQDLTNQQFGRWTVLRYSHTKDRRIYWLCECSCPDKTQRAVWASDLRRAGFSRRGSASCGCLMRELASIRSTKHGLAHHPAYHSWQQMDQRCNNPKNTMYDLYGGRGISMCERWQEFKAFWEDMGPTWREGLSIDRMDSNGNYEASNCCWSTPKEQANNRRTNHIIQTPEGPMNVTEAGEQFGIDASTIFARIRYGWDEKDLLLPV